MNLKYPFSTGVHCHNPKKLLISGSNRMKSAIDEINPEKITAGIVFRPIDTKNK